MLTNTAAVYRLFRVLSVEYHSTLSQFSMLFTGSMSEFIYYKYVIQSRSRAILWQYCTFVHTSALLSHTFIMDNVFISNCCLRISLRCATFVDKDFLFSDHAECWTKPSTCINESATGISIAAAVAGKPFSHQHIDLTSCAFYDRITAELSNLYSENDWENNKKADMEKCRIYRRNENFLSPNTNNQQLAECCCSSSFIECEWKIIMRCEL